ncbi:hypothetical protein [Corynebacterium pacaense]|uniref:hypothetical protein n=1 Tax=Corynebacterium pacaense TaxID=1816684 RepID=UPI0009BA03FD|nr:hypothetical protein [Corynebacterium pacaense]
MVAGCIRARWPPRGLDNDRGSVTVEAALALSAMVVVCALIIASMATMLSYLVAVDTAGAAARAYAIGEDFHPPRGGVNVSESEGLVTVRASVPSPFGVVSADAVFPSETR